MMCPSNLQDFLYILPVNSNTPSNMEFEKLSSPLFQWVAKTPAVSFGGLLRNDIAKIQLRKGLYAWPNSMGISEAKQLPGLICAVADRPDRSWFDLLEEVKKALVKSMLFVVVHWTSDKKRQGLCSILIHILRSSHPHLSFIMDSCYQQSIHLQ